MIQLIQEADYSARFYKPTKLYEGYKLSRYKFMTAGHFQVVLSNNIMSTTQG